MIGVRQLRYFVAVSEELHFGRAAERLHITQPPLSQAIRKLEDELGVELLHRTSRYVSLTDAGRVFAEEARIVIAAFDRAVAEARRVGGTQATLRIACMPELPVERFLSFLGALRHHEPAQSVEIVHLPPLEQVRRLNEGELDLAIVPDADWPDGLELHPLFAGEPLAAFMSPEHSLAGADVLTPAELRSETLAVLPREASQPVQDRVTVDLEEAGYEFAATHEASGASVRDLMLSVASGVGIAVAPVSATHTSGTGDVVVQVLLDPPVRAPDTVLAWSARPHGSVRALVDVLSEIAQTCHSPDFVAAGSAGFSRAQ